MDGRFIKSSSIDTQYFLWDVKSYNKEYLLCDNNQSLSSAYIFVSKGAGKIKDPIDLRLKENIEPYISVKENGMIFEYSPYLYNLVKVREGFLLSQISAGTFYVLNEKEEIKPIFTRLPSIHEQSIPIFVNVWVESN